MIGERLIAARLTLALVAATVSFVACGEAGARAMAVGGERVPAHVDSLLPIEEEVRRFRATLDRPPRELRGGAESLESLVAAVAAAVNAGDENALRALTVDRAEFAYFYYPYTIYVRPPYELGPGLVWFQLVNQSSRGVNRLERTFATRRLEPAGVVCHRWEPAGRGRVLSDCRMSVRADDGGRVDVRLFSRVLERDGTFKVLSYANDL